MPFSFTSKTDENGNPTEEDLGHTMELQYGEKTIYTDITTDGTRFTVGGETNFSLTYANGGIKLSITNESTGFNYSFEKSSGEISALLEKNGVSAPRTSGCFLIGDHQSMGGRITLKKLDIQNNNITVTDASAPYKGFAVFGNDTQNEISLDTSFGNAKVFLDANPSFYKNNKKYVIAAAFYNKNGALTDVKLAMPPFCALDVQPAEDAVKMRAFALGSFDTLKPAADIKEYIFK